MQHTSPAQPRLDADRSAPKVDHTSFASAGRHPPFSLVLSDALDEDNPLIYVNSAFEKLTGYTAASCVGRNCRFLQGKGTSEEDRDRISAAIANEQDIVIDILNYRANGEEFLNRLMIAPVQTGQGRSTHFLGIQSEVPNSNGDPQRSVMLSDALRSMHEKVRDQVALILSLMRPVAGPFASSPYSLQALELRLELINLLHSEFASRTGRTGKTVSLGPYFSRICNSIGMRQGRGRIATNLEIETLEVPLDAALHAGMILTELFVNSLQHGFIDSDLGQISVRLWSDHQEKTVCLMVEDDGCGLPERADWPRRGQTGARVVREMVRRLGANLDMHASWEGTCAYLTIPLSSMASE